MGWMHDTLEYFQTDPLFRRYHQNELTFGLVYAWSENFVLPISHDEVVHGKGSLLTKMPGDRWQQLANLRAFLAWMWAHPGKQLLFMGSELGQEREWNHDRDLDWWLLETDGHRGIQGLVSDLNRLYKSRPALWTQDVKPEGFAWIDASDAEQSVVSFLRIAAPASASGGAPDAPSWPSRQRPRRRRHRGLHRQSHPGAPRRLPDRSAEGGGVGGVAQHRRLRVGRQRAGQRRTGDRVRRVVARPAGVGRADPAAPQRPVAPACP